MAYTTSNEIDSLIIAAGVRGDLAKLKEFQEKFGDERKFRIKCDLSNDCCTGRRVLHIAAELGHFEICKFLVENVRVSIDVLSDRGDTPLLYAVKEEHVRIVEYLINHGALVDMFDSKGLTSLHYAVKKGNEELIELLLKKCSPITIEADSVDGTPLQCAASCGSVETVKLLLDHGAEPNSVSWIFGSPLICSIKAGSFECMNLLLKAGANPNEFLAGLTPLAHAAEEGKAEIIKSLLEAGADPNLLSTNKLTPAEVAALASNFEAVGILFPLTRRFQNYSNLTADLVMKLCHCEPAKTTRDTERSSTLSVLDINGKDAVRKGDYYSAILSYSKAAFLDPTNPKWLSNRSLCFAREGYGVFALRDAVECVRMNPDCVKAHYREGAAWKVLENYYMSTVAFGKAWQLAPDDKEVQLAHTMALYELIHRLRVKFPEEMKAHMLDPTPRRMR